MTNDGVPPGEERDDSPWRPDAAVSFEHPPRRSFDVPPNGRSDGSPESTSDSPSPRIPFGRSLIAVLVVLVVVGGAFVVVRDGERSPRGDVDVSAGDDSEDLAERMIDAGDLGGDVILAVGDTPLPTLAACHAQRLPPTLEPLWDLELLDARRVVAPVIVGDESVVAVVESEPQAGEDSPVSVVAIDVDDGQERWRAEVPSSTGGPEVVGIVERAVIVRSTPRPDGGRRRLFAFDEDTGRLLWDRGFRGDWSAAADTATGVVYVSVRRPAVSTSTESEIEVLDARAGRRVHVAAGVLIGQDSGGRLVTRLGDQVLATSPTERDLLGVVDPPESPFAAVGTDLVVANGNDPELRRYSGSDDVRTVPLVGSPVIEPPGFVVAIEPLGGPSLLVTGGGAVHGAQVRDDAVEIRWRVTGVVVESVATERGRALLVATEGGAQQRVVDGSTGRTIVGLDLRPGALTTLALVSNGVVVQDVVGGDPMRVAVDLDGRELWSLAGSGAVAIGPGVVVTVEDTDADGAVRVAAAGGALDETADRAECRTDTAGDETEPVLLGATVSDR